jgi:hypothetical protein
MLVDHTLRLGVQVDEMLAEDARPDDVDLENVDVAGSCGEELLIEREALGGGIGRGYDLDRVARPFRPGVHPLFADFVFLAESAAGNRNLDRVGMRGCRQSHEECHDGEAAGHVTLPFSTCCLAA